MAHNRDMKINDSATIWLGDDLAPGTPLLLIMHGFGANERDLAPLVDFFPGPFSAACIRAPMPIPQFPGGFAWFPITDNPGVPEMAIADDAVAAVMDWLEGTVAGTDVGPIVPIGFSQGGAMVVHLLRHHPERFAAGVVMSGFTVPGEVAGDGRLAASKPPVFFGYDPDDPVVPGAAFERTREFGVEHFTLEDHIYRVAHGINQEELADVAAFLTRVLAED